MSTSIVVAPAQGTVFQFQATFDGASYAVRVLWNIFDQGWYFQIVNSSGTIVWMQRLNGPPTLNLVYGLFTTSTMTYDDASRTITISP